MMKREAHIPDINGIFITVEPADMSSGGKRVDIKIHCGVDILICLTESEARKLLANLRDVLRNVYGMDNLG